MAVLLINESFLYTVYWDNLKIEPLRVFVWLHWLWKVKQRFLKTVYGLTAEFTLLKLGELERIVQTDIFLGAMVFQTHHELYQLLLE